MNIEQAAKLYRVHRRTIYNLINRGELITTGKGADRRIVLNPEYKYIRDKGKGFKK